MLHFVVTNGDQILAHAELSDHDFARRIERHCTTVQDGQARLGFVRLAQLNDFEAAARFHRLLPLVPLADLVWDNPGATIVISSIKFWAEPEAIDNAAQPE